MMVPMPVVYLLAAIAALAILLAAALVVVLARSSRRHLGQIDRLLLLGKSSSVGEAVSAYERLNRLERARAEIEAQRDRQRARVAGAAPEDGAGVARKSDAGRNWFGTRRRPPTPQRTEG